MKGAGDPSGCQRPASESAICGARLIVPRGGDPPDPVAGFLDRLGPASRPTMTDALRWFARALQRDNPHAVAWATLRQEHTLALRERLAEERAPATANKMLVALRGVLKECWRLDLMSAEDYQRAVDFSPVRGRSAPRGRLLSRCEINALFNACAAGAGPASARDAAILALGYGAGLRVSEITTLDVEDYEPRTGALLVRGRGLRERVVYAADGTKDALDVWLQTRGPAAGSIFWSGTKGGRLLAGRRMTRAAINQMLGRRAAEAGVGAVAPHDLRQSFISGLLDQGLDLARVQRLAGHANPQTTARYARRKATHQRQSCDALPVPYHRPSASGRIARED
jgi:site-specific recombinase XerD